MRQMIQLLAQESIGQRVVRFFEVRADAVDSAVDAGLGFAVKLGSQPAVATRERSAAVSRTAWAFASTCGRRGCRQSAGHDFLAFSCPPLLELYYVLERSGVSSELQCKPIVEMQRGHFAARVFALRRD